MGKKSEKYRVYAGGNIIKAENKCAFCNHAKYLCTFYIQCKKHNKKTDIRKTCDDYTHNKNLLNLEDSIEKAKRWTKKPLLRVGGKSYIVTPL